MNMCWNKNSNNKKLEILRNNTLRFFLRLIMTVYVHININILKGMFDRNMRGGKGSLHI